MIEDLVGIPYVIDGRDAKGADCWGLVVLYFATVHGLDVPRYDAAASMTELDRRALAAMIADGIAPPWVVVQEPRPGDVVLIRHGTAVSHVGIYLDGARVLHSPGPGPSVIERIASPHMARRVVGFYRHEALL